MLKRVGNPVAINPARELLDSIKMDKELSDKAKVVIERKDTIYTLQPNQANLIDVEETANNFSFE